MRNSRSTTGGAAAALLALAAALLLGPLSAAAAECGAEHLSVAQARAAAFDVLEQVRDSHYVSGASDAAIAALTQLAGSLAEPLPAALLAHRLDTALAFSEDAHLRLELPQSAASTCRVLPLRLDWTDRGLLALPGSVFPAGTRIIEIGGRTLQELESLARAAIPHENLYWVHSVFARKIVRADTLSAFGLMGADGSVEFTYNTREGATQRKRVRLGAAAKTGRAWVGFQAFPQDSTGLLWLERCDPNDEFYSTLAAFMRTVRQQNLRKVAIDLRGNPGGDSSVAIAVLRSLGLTAAHGFSVDVRPSAALIHDMPLFAPAAIAPIFTNVGLPPPAPSAAHYTIPGPIILNVLAQRLGDRTFETVTGRELYILTDGGTFSSASLFALLVRDNDLGTLVGEPIGNAVSFNGSEIERPIPHMTYVLHVSTARLGRPDDSAGPGPALLPDLRAPLTPAALAQGRDPALELIRKR